MYVFINRLTIPGNYLIITDTETCTELLVRVVKTLANKYNECIHNYSVV